MRRLSLLLALPLFALPLFALSLAACGGPATEAPAPVDAPPPAPTARGEVVHFGYDTLEGKPLTTESMAGRIALIAFLTTYDFPSQAEARFLSSIQRSHTPRLNVAALVLEPPENRPLVEAFVKALHLGYPVALADEATIAGQGPFAGLHHVPSVVILDKRGREVWRHVGLVEEAAIEEALRAVEKKGDY